MAAAGVDAEPHGQLLNHVEHRNQQQHQGQQAIAPLRAALGRRDDIAGVGVGQHDDEAGPPDRDRAGERGGADVVRLRFGVHRAALRCTRRAPPHSKTLSHSGERPPDSGHAAGLFRRLAVLATMGAGKGKSIDRKHAPPTQAACHPSRSDAVKNRVSVRPRTCCPERLGPGRARANRGPRARWSHAICR